MKQQPDFFLKLAQIAYSSALISIKWHFVWIAVKAASWTTVHDWLSTSYTALERDFLAAIILLIFVLRGAKRTGNGWRATLAAWGREILQQSTQAGGVVLLAVIIFTVGLFAYNLHDSYRIFASHRPKLELTWTKQTSGFELSAGVPQPDLTPEYLRDRQQYVIEISYPKDYLVPVAASVLFQFPYPVDQWKINALHTAPPGFGPSASPLPLILRGGNFQFHGEQQHRNWVLNVPEIDPGGTVRLLVTLNSNPQGLVISQGVGPAPNVASPQLASSPLRGPLYEYIRTSVGFTFGQQVGAAESCVPFQIDSNKNITVGDFGDPPQNLQASFEMP